MSLGGNVRGIELVERTPRKQLAGECHPRWWLFCLGFAVGRFWGLWCILFCGVVFLKFTFVQPFISWSQFNELTHSWPKRGPGVFETAQPNPNIAGVGLSRVVAAPTAHFTAPWPKCGPGIFLRSIRPEKPGSGCHGWLRPQRFLCMATTSCTTWTTSTSSPGACPG